MKSTDLGNSAIKKTSQICAACATAISLAATCYLVPLRGDVVPVDSTLSPVVPLFNAWTIWWNSETVRRGASLNLESYWAAPIFAPAHNAFAYSEPQPITAVFTLPIMWGLSPVWAANLYLALSIALNGLAATAFSKTWCRSSGTLIFAAAAMVTLPVLSAHRHVVQLVPVWPLIWMTHEGLMCWQRPGWWRGTRLGLAFAMTTWCSIHQALVVSVVAMIAFPLLGALCLIGRSGKLSDNKQPRRDGTEQRFPPRFCACAALALLVGGIFSSPFILPVYLAARSEGFQRGTETVERLSADLDSHLTAPPTVWSPVPHRRFEVDQLKLPTGYWVFSGAFAGLVLLRPSQSAKRSFVIAVGVSALVGVVLSFGEHLRIGDTSLWSSLVAIVPGLAQMRNVYRFAIPAHVWITLLACGGFDEMLTRARSSNRPRVMRTAVWAAAALSIMHLLPPRPALAGVPPRHETAPWQQLIAEKTSPGDSILCLPMGAGKTLDGFYDELRWMHIATVHGRPLVNGYSGFFPDHYLNLRNQLNAAPLTSEAVLSLYSLGVRLIMIDPRKSARLNTQTLPVEELLASESACLYRIHQQEQ